MFRKISHIFFALVGFGVGMGLAPIAVWATTSDPPLISLEVPIAGQQTVVGISGYIELLYRFGISSIGIAATLMIMWGGFKWISAAGNSQRITDAQDTIYNAIIGLMLALLSYTLLYVINTAFLKNEIPNIEEPELPVFVKVESLIGCNHPSLGENACKSVGCGKDACPYGAGGVFCRPDACSSVDNQGNPQKCQLHPETLKYQCLSDKEASDIRRETFSCQLALDLCREQYTAEEEQQDCYCDMYIKLMDVENTEGGYNTCTNLSCGGVTCYPEGTKDNFICKAIQ